MDCDYVDWSFTRIEGSITRTYYVTVEYAYSWQPSGNWFSPDRWEVYDWRLVVPSTMWVEQDNDDTKGSFHPLSQDEINMLVLTKEETADLLEFLDSLGCPSNVVYSHWDE